MPYDRRQIQLESVSAIVHHTPTPENLRRFWESQRQAIMGRPYRVMGRRRERFEADLLIFRQRCAELNADPYRVMYGIFAMTRFIRSRVHSDYLPFTELIRSERIFTWWQAWERDAVEMIGTNFAEVVADTSASQLPLRVRPYKTINPAGLRRLLVKGFIRLTEYHQQYPRLTALKIIETYGTIFPRLIHWAVGRPIELTPVEQKYLKQLSEREFLRVQIQAIFPDHRLPE